MPRGFERNIIWSNGDDPDRQPRYVPFVIPGPYRPSPWSDYDLGFLASLRIRA